jgi:hypothetical protein
MAGPGFACVARSSCNLASYPGDGVAVGGAAIAGAMQAQTPSVVPITAKAAQNRFMSFLPAACSRRCTSSRSDRISPAIVTIST